MNLFAPALTYLDFEKKDSWDIDQKNDLLANTNDNGLIADNFAESQNKAIKSKLNLLYIFKAICKFLGWLILFIDALMVYDLFEDKPLLKFTDSIFIKLLIIIAVLILAFVFFNRGNSCDERLCTMCKQNLVQPRLQKYFNITDYVYYDILNGRSEIENLLKSLMIANNDWTHFSYSDYIRGTFHNVPFIFFDCYMNIEIGRSTQCVFYGQIIVMKTKAFSGNDFNLHANIEKSRDASPNPIPFYDHTQNLYIPEMLLSEDKKLAELPVHDEASDKSAETKPSLSDTAPALSYQEVIHLLNSQTSALYAIQEIAGCDTGFVLSKDYFAILICNAYNPFEFSSKELFGSYKKLFSKLDGQAYWLRSVMEEAEKTGWL